MNQGSSSSAESDGDSGLQDPASPLDGVAAANAALQGIPQGRRVARLPDQRQFIRKFKDMLQNEMDKGHDFGGALTRILDHFRDHERRVLLAERTGVWTPAAPASAAAAAAAAAAATVETGTGTAASTPAPARRRNPPTIWSNGISHVIEGSRVIITGPAEGDRGELLACNVQAVTDLLDWLDPMCRAVGIMEDAARDSVEQQRELAEAEQSGDRHVAAAVVREHIRLLQRYNDIKDIAQQLIGLVADNRGVSIGSLYRHGEFGVGPED